MLGDRLVRRRKKRKPADAFLQELATLSPGDLVVHADHGIGRYEGLTQIPVSKVPHDCVALEYARGDKLYVPVENIELLSRYGSESEGVSLDSLGGEAWQRRKSRMKERIREIAGELIKVAALRATRSGVVAEPDASYPAIRRPLSVRGNRRPGPRDRRRARRLGSGPADGSAGVRRRRFRQDRGSVAGRFRHGDVGQAGRARVSDHPARSPALFEFRRAIPWLPDQHRPPVAPCSFSRSKADEGGTCRRHGRHRHRDPRDPREEHRLQAPGTRYCRRRATFRSGAQGAAEGAQGRRPRADADGNADPSNPANGDERTSRAERDPDATSRSPCRPDLRYAFRRRRSPRGAATRTFPRRAELLRRAPRRRPDRHGGMDPSAGPRGKGHHCPRADERDRGRGTDERLLRPQI